MSGPIQVDLCGKCQRTKPIAEFYRYASGRILKPCKECKIAYRRTRQSDPVHGESIRSAARTKYVPKTRQSPAQRFWLKVSKGAGDSCWLWTGSTNSAGYGLFSYPRRGSRCLAHRFSHFLAAGTMPSLMVLHRCDTPRCVRPDHLFLGTHRDNMADMVAKGRSAGAKGEASPRSKLTAALVTSMRREFATGGFSRGEIARRYGISTGAVGHILKGINWKHLLTTGEQK